jgi:hypothetical protein
MQVSMTSRLGGILLSSSRAICFFVSLAMATTLPIFLLPIIDVEYLSARNDLIWCVWIFAGYGHVMSTVWFGTDTQYGEVIRNNRVRMLGPLAMIPIAMGAVALSS